MEGRGQSFNCDETFKILSASGLSCPTIENLDSEAAEPGESAAELLPLVCSTGEGSIPPCFPLPSLSARLAFVFPQTM